MYTEHMTQCLSIAGTPIHAQQLTTTITLTTGKVDLAALKRALFVLDLGVFGGTSPTCSAVLTIQESPDGTTWTNNGTVSTLTVAVASSVGTSEIRADQLGAGKRYVRASVVFTIGGTSPIIPAVVIPLGGEAIRKPASAQNDASVASQAVTN
jgi:hypothetical protein